MKWELNFIKWSAGWWSSPILDEIIPWLTHFGSHFSVILFILVSWIVSGKAEVLGGFILIYATQSVITYGLKYLIRRSRPVYFLGTTDKFSRGPGEILDPSFPSAHTVHAFMMAMLLSQWFPSFQAVFYVMAGFIGWTRIYLTLHYPTDVLAGTLLGCGITKMLLHSLRLGF
jgi:undecaprenyl-diphosphatase